MNIIENIKSIIYFAAWKIHIDTFFRYFNRKKILILAYHGIAENEHEMAPWTLIHRDIFEQQIKYISLRYNAIPLVRAVESITTGADLPSNAVVITFDDGYRNNFTTAMPILKKYNAPATIFVTAGYVGTSKILPLDEVYVIIKSSSKTDPFSVPELGLGTLQTNTPLNAITSCQNLVDRLKKFPAKIQLEFIDLLRELLHSDKNQYDKALIEELRILSWDEIKNIVDSGLIHIGAHTVSHEILTNISSKEAQIEIVESKEIIEEHLKQEVSMFAYPNGTAADYNEDHINILKQNGFICSVTTNPIFNKVLNDPYRLGRMSIGTNPSADQSNFALRISGLTPALKNIFGRKNA